MQGRRRVHLARPLLYLHLPLLLSISDFPHFSPLSTSSPPLSGLTDSGKSFTSKLLTSQLLRLSSSSTKSEIKLSSSIKSLDILLNSFSCCKTSFNSNASRVSNYSELHFDKDGRLRGKKLLTFGLEKGRVNKLKSEERSFHVFYQMLAGATNEERDEWRLDDVTNYDLLNSSGCYR